MKLRTIVAAAGLAGAMALTTACSGADTTRPTGAGATADAAQLALTPTTAKAKGEVSTVNWLLEDEPDSLDLDTQGGSAGRTVLSNVCERLYQLQPDMSVKPSLVRQATGPDDKTLVLSLRDDVVFHDGSRDDGGRRPVQPPAPRPAGDGAVRRVRERRGDDQDR
ncbi:ABC-type transport system substrate-binding protein [Streptomyces pristinaespiralis]